MGNQSTYLFSRWIEGRISRDLEGAQVVDTESRKSDEITMEMEKGLYQEMWTEQNKLRVESWMKKD